MLNILRTLLAMGIEVFAGPKGSAISFRMEKKADKADSVDVYLYDVIGETWDGEGMTAKRFATELKAAGDLKTINIFINSEGGSVFEGVAIYNVLRRHKAKKMVHIDGLAASIASVIAMAGDEIKIARNGIMMIHDPWAAGFIVGTAADFREQGEKIAVSLDKIREALLATYVERTNLSEKKISDWMAGETWFTAAEAVKHGFADAMSDEDVAVAALAQHDFSRFKNMPRKFAALVESSQLLPLAALDYSWDVEAANGRVNQWADAGNRQTDLFKLRRAHLQTIDGTETAPTHFSLLFTDIIDGKLTAVPRGLMACASAVAADATVPDSIKQQISRYFAKMREEFNDGSILPPWEKVSAPISAEATADKFRQIADRKNRLANLQLQ